MSLGRHFALRRLSLEEPAPLVSREKVALLLAVLVLLVAAAGGFAPLGMTSPAQVALAMLLVATILWVAEAVPLFVTGFLVLLMSLVWLAPALRTEGQPVDDAVFLAPFFSDVILLFLGGFVLAAGLHRCRLDEYIAHRIVARATGSVPVLIAGILAVTAFLSMWLSNTATAAMMLALCLPIARSLPPDDRYRKAIVLAVPFAANIGGLGTPIGSPPNAIAMQYMAQQNIQISFGHWMVMGVPGVLVMLLLTWGVLMCFFRGTASRLSTAPAERPFAFNASARWVSAIAILTALGWITGEWHGCSAGTVAILPIVAFFGPRILTLDDLRALPWDVLMMMGGGLCLGAAASLSGLADWVVEQLPLAGNSLPVMMALFGSLAIGIGSLMSNTATANVLMPLILGLGAAQQAPMLVSTAFCCSLAMPLPISTPPNAMAFSSGDLTTSDMLRAGLTITLLGLLLAVTAGALWWDLVGLF